jgi:hypothetical protein
LADVSEAIFADGFELPCPGAPPGVVPGAGSGLLLRGTIVTPTVAFVGEVLVQGDTIACVAASCAGSPARTPHRSSRPRGLSFRDSSTLTTRPSSTSSTKRLGADPGLHVSPGWTSDPRYGALVDAKQYLNGRRSAVDYGCEMEKYGELKH